MSISVKTPAPATLLNDLKKIIYEKNITSWLCDSEGDFTLRAEDFRGKAWFRPFERGDVLAFGLIGQNDKKNICNISCKFFRISSDKSGR